MLTSLSDLKMEVLFHGRESFHGMIFTRVFVNPHNAIVEQIGLAWNQKSAFLPFALTLHSPFHYFPFLIFTNTKLVKKRKRNE